MGAPEDGDLYELLGVARDATPAQLKKAYRKMAVKHHPDKNPERREEAEAMFKEVAEAYEVLSDPEKRQVYDQLGRAGLDGSEPATHAVNPHELFAQFFRGFGKAGVFSANFQDPFGSFTGAFPREAPRLVRQPLHCTLEELFLGTTKRMRVRRRRLGAQPSETSVLEIRVQPGWKPNTRITFRGAGDELAPGEFQDIMFVVVEKEHARFRRHGSDLVYRATVTLADALTGFALTVQMLDGSEVRVEVDQVVRPGATKVIRGKGMPSSREGGKRGNLVIEFDVKFPERLDEEQKRTIRATL